MCAGQDPNEVAGVMLMVNVVPLKFLTDLNHRIRQLGKDAFKQYNPQIKKNKGIAAAIKKYFAAAMHQHKLKPMEKLRAALENVIDHLLGVHTHCAEHFDCPAAKAALAGGDAHKPADLPGREYLDPLHRIDLEKMFKRHLDTERLLQCQHDYDSQSNEALNNVSALPNFITIVQQFSGWLGHR